MTRRGEVVLLDFPFTDLKASKIRPAVVVARDDGNVRFRTTIVAMISGNVKRADDPFHVLIDPAMPDGASSGLHGISLTCMNLYTIDRKNVIRTLGNLSSDATRRLNQALQATLDL